MRQVYTLSPMEEARHFAFMRDTYKYSAQEIANEYGTSRIVVQEYLSISELPEGVARATGLDKRHLYALSKLIDRDGLIKARYIRFGASSRPEEFPIDPTKKTICRGI